MSKLIGYQIHFISCINVSKQFLSLHQVSSFTVSCPVSIGELHGIELDKQPPEIQDDWFPVKVVVKSPEGGTYKFPIFRSITTSDVQYFEKENGL